MGQAIVLGTVRKKLISQADSATSRFRNRSTWNLSYVTVVRGKGAELVPYQYLPECIWRNGCFRPGHQRIYGIREIDGQAAAREASREAQVQRAPA